MRKLPILFALAALAGCGSPCQDLADRICNCQPQGGLRDNCKSSVRGQLGQSNPDDATQRFCEGRLATCPDPEKTSTACDLLLTAAGKVACGLAFPSPSP